MPAARGSSPPVVVRVARAADVPAIVALRERGPSPDPSGIATRRALESDATVLVAATADGPPEVRGVVVGRFVVRPPIWRARRVIEIPTLALAGSATGHPSDHGLLPRLLETFASRDAESVLASASAGPTPERACLETLGFTPWMRTLEARAEALDARAALDASAAIRIRDAAPQDLATLARLWCAMLEENADVDARFALHAEARSHETARLAARIGDARHVFVLAEDRAGCALGLAAAQADVAAPSPPDDASTPRAGVTITAASVVPAARRLGIARRLVAALARRLVRLLDARGGAPARLHVVARNAGSLAFWEALGARPVLDLLERAPPTRGAATSSPSPGTRAPSR